jgi:hypothetical protein
MTRLWRPAALVLFALTTSLHGAGRALAPRDLGPSPYRQSFPVIGSADGRFLTLWREERRGFGTHVMGSLSEASGKRISPISFPVVPDANPVWMQLVPHAGGYTLFWSHSFQTTHMVDLDLSGKVLASRQLDVPYHIQRDIAWNGTHFLMAFKHSAGITHDAEAILFTRTGEVVRRGIPLDDLLYNVDVEVSGDGFVVVTAGFDGMFAHRITGEGGVQQTVLVPKRFDTQNRPIRPLAISRGDGTLLLVWSGGDQARSELQSAVLDEAGELTDGRIIAARDATRRLLHPLVLTRNGGEYTLAFAETDQRFQEQTLLSTMTLDAAGVRVGQSEPLVLGSGVPAAASNGTVISVAYSERYLPERLQQRAVDNSGSTTAPEFVAIARARQLQPIIGAGGGRFVAAWTEQSEKSSARLASLDAFGEPRSHRFVAADAEFRGSDLVWNGNEYLFVYRLMNNNLEAMRLDADGNAIDPKPLQLGGGIPVQYAAVAWTGEKWIVIWTMPHGASFAHVSAAGVVTARGEWELRTPLKPGWSRLLGPIAIAADRTRVAVAWIETQYPPCLMPICQGQETKAWLQRFNHSGTPTTNYGVAVADDPSRVSLVYNGEEYLLLIDTQEKTDAMLLTDGAGMSLLARRAFPSGLSDVMWDGTEFVMAQRYRRETGWLVVTRFDRKLEDTAPPRGVLTLRSDETDAPSVAAMMSGGALVTIAEGDALDGSRAVVYAERDMQPLPGWPPPRRRAVR